VDDVTWPKRRRGVKVFGGRTAAGLVELVEVLRVAQAGVRQRLVVAPQVVDGVFSSWGIFI